MKKLSAMHLVNKPLRVGMNNYKFIVSGIAFVISCHF